MYCLRAAAKMRVFAVEGNLSTIVHLTGEQLRVHRFPWPPDQEQSEIVAHLDQAAHVTSQIGERLGVGIARVGTNGARFSFRLPARTLAPWRRLRMTTRRKKIFEGKGKILYEGPEPGTLIQYFKDDANALNSQKKAVPAGPYKKLHLPKRALEEL